VLGVLRRVPAGYPQSHKDEERRVAFKCDLCMSREGGPVCVEVCDQGRDNL